MASQESRGAVASLFRRPPSRRVARAYFALAGAWLVLSTAALYLLSVHLEDFIRGALEVLFLSISAPLLYVVASRQSRDEAEQRRHVGRKLGEMEDRYQALFERSRDSIYLVSFDGRFLDANQAALDLLGYRREDIPHVTLPSLLHPDDLPRVMTAFAEAARTGAAAGEFRMRRKDGAQVVVDISSSVVYAGGKPHSVQGIARDVTDRKRAEEALRESEQRYRVMVEQSISGFYVIQDGVFRYANPRMAEILGYASPSEIVGRAPTALTVERDRALVEDNIRRRMAGEVNSLSYTLTGLRKDGSEVDIGVHGTRITSNGRPAIMGLMQDISESKRAEREIQRYIARLEQAMQGTISTVATIGELRDPYTQGHERRVGEIAAGIAAELGLPPNDVEGVRIAGYLHDVGKIAVPAEILAKPTRLSQAEFELVKAHPRHSHDVLKGVSFPWPVAEAALQHHERWDGSGYPRGLVGDAIILPARILGVADTVEAMASHRPYRPGLGLERALQEIEQNRGHLYDGAVVDACLRLFRERSFRIPE